jgi:hypothetical protein
MTDAPPPPPPSGTPPTPPTPPAAPTPKPVKPGSATTLIWRRPDRATLTGALVAVIVGWGLTIVLHLLYLIESISWSINDGPSTFLGGVGDFFFYGIWQSLFFFGPAFVALWLLLPIVKESTLPKVMLRAAAAGVVGLVGLILFGIVDAVVDIGRFGFAFGYFSVTWLWFPIITALGLTIQLVLGAVIAWLRAHREPKAAPPAA